MSTEGACPGACNRRYREAHEAFKQALAEYDEHGRLDPNQSRPIPPDIHPDLGNPWCGNCKSRIRESLAELDILAALLAATADGHRAGPGGERVSGTAIHMSPSQAGDDLDELVSILAEWQSDHRERMHWEFEPRHGHLAAPETEHICWLMRHLDEILASPPAVEFGQEVLQWHREIKDKTKAGVRTRTVPVRCHQCELLTLTETDGNDYLTCRNCGVMVSKREYEAEVARLGGALADRELGQEVA